MTRPLLAQESPPLVQVLRSRLDDFYRNTKGYDAFQNHSWHPDLWSYVADELQRGKTKSCRVLEIGAGRTGFRRYLRERGVSAHFTAQDVTPQNESFLHEECDEVIIGPLSNVAGSFDLIFSTFVLEHVTDPRATLETMWKLLRPGGSLFIFCPRYDVPFYLSHSADHYPIPARVAIALRLLAARFAAIVTREPRFLIHVDPAVFVLPWSRDRDAVHWVSYVDLAIWFKDRGRVNKLRVPSGSLKDAIAKNFLQVNIRVTKPDARDEGR